MTKTWKVTNGFNLVTDSVAPFGGRQSKTSWMEVDSPPNGWIEGWEIKYNGQIGDEAFVAVEEQRLHEGKVTWVKFKVHTRSKNNVGCRGHVTGDIVVTFGARD